MQTLLRSGELPVRDGRRLAALPGDDQLPTWRREREQADRDRFTAVNPVPDPAKETGGRAEPGQTRTSPAADTDRQARPGRVSFPREATVAQIADVLRGCLSHDDLRTLVEVLTG